jgi:hypothetical protein
MQNKTMKKSSSSDDNEMGQDVSTKENDSKGNFNQIPLISVASENF